MFVFRLDEEEGATEEWVAKKRLDFAHKIRDTFVREDAESSVNIAARLRRRLLAVELPPPDLYLIAPNLRKDMFVLISAYSRSAHPPQCANTEYLTTASNGNRHVELKKEMYRVLKANFFAAFIKQMSRRPGIRK